MLENKKKKFSSQTYLSHNFKLIGFHKPPLIKEQEEQAVI
jgi:hypothetical protein